MGKARKSKQNKNKKHPAAFTPHVHSLPHPCSLSLATETTLCHASRACPRLTSGGNAAYCFFSSSQSAIDRPLMMSPHPFRTGTPAFSHAPSGALA